ncbi:MULTISPECIES: Ppx/GppA phosphatase family protein [unclassified Mesorhizobium]|uniref:Ppx/GppA phosphatase family protein n=1 Tax=unclassified Mesorhizobium TaxID=325217 RepID=UPI000BB0481D|nr:MULTISPECIES: Ppx/GppA phosphatase family protein [unclassified Mesorhizobium]TGT60193.1 Ppx/GppA family phosphatase [Mesorhizobium sp. M00.F.Ca.ET.170.01.1.1]AZO08358.1 Ppx/GppA family phosphatase [Mesorhizobium sp. M3A.F.Ca.ET.080.04.2.1]PBB84647.1 exopolyphosphatase [Mesorhizobium sp. WSM3876]RWB72223.1 MAG: Ppx/GppA family phosphatase [Mesorhizobium sp.]RWB89375.1 MAG: Ppx/GppA family phosphatase [Mesorhizobium sp.]
MEDHDTGARAPAVGMPGASPSEPAGPSARRSERHAAEHRGARHADRPGEHQKGKTRKRRKRRRGRKVFARDENGAVALSPAPAVLPPEPAPTPPQSTPAQGAPRPPQQELPVFAALDLGTNNCRLLVAVPSRHGQFRVIDAFSRIVRLGEGLAASGRLGQAAMDRAVEALKVCGDKLRNRKIRKARLIATEACRAAQNGLEFLDRVEREAGLKLEIIDRQTEARLAVSGCGSLVERDTQGVVLFDIGGGSSEIALIDLTRGHRSPRLANHIVSWTSLPVGVVSLAERFGGRTVTRETFAAMVEDVAVRLKAFDGRDRLAHVLASPNFHLLGTSGTVTTLAGVHLDLDRYDRRRVDGLWMNRESVDRMVEKLIGWDFQQRVANPCIGADRADLVLAGCAILEAIRGVWPSERLRVADRGLREGILSELMADDGAWRR